MRINQKGQAWIVTQAFVVQVILTLENHKQSSENIVDSIRFNYLVLKLEDHANLTKSFNLILIR